MCCFIPVCHIEHVSRKLIIVLGSQSPPPFWNFPDLFNLCLVSLIMLICVLTYSLFCRSIVSLIYVILSLLPFWNIQELFNLDLVILFCAYYCSGIWPLWQQHCQPDQKTSSLARCPLEYPWFVRPLHLPCKLGSSFCTCCGIGLWSPLQQHSWLDIEYIPIGLLGFWNLLDSFNLCLVRLLALVALVIILAFGLLCDNIVTQAMNTPLGQLAIWNLDDLFNLCLVIFVALICVLVFNLFYIIIGSQILNTLFVLLLFWNIQK